MDLTWRDKQQYANLEWQGRNNEAIRKNSVVLGLNQNGSNFHLVSLLGVLRFRRGLDAKNIVQHLRQMADLIEREAVDR